jgi:hypothetical protein
MSFLLELQLLPNGQRLRGHDHFWDVIREKGAAGAEFTVLEIVEKTNAHKATVHDFILRLTRAEPVIVEPCGWRGEGHWRQRTFRLVRTPLETPSLRRDGKTGLYGRARQQMWNVIRHSGAQTIDATDVAMLAATDTVAINLGSAKEYLQRLAAAGYLAVAQKAAQHRLERYRLRPEMDTGPLAPKLLRTRVVYDPNKRQLVGSSVAEEIE